MKGVLAKYKSYVFFALYLVINPRLLRLVGKVYLPTYIQYEWLRKYKIRTIIDVGAYKGDVSRTLHFLFPRAKIFAFEPLREHLRKLETSVPGKNLEVECAAVSDKSGETRFYENKYAQGSSLLPMLE